MPVFVTFDAGLGLQGGGKRNPAKAAPPRELLEEHKATAEYRTFPIDGLALSVARVEPWRFALVKRHQGKSSALECA